MDKLFNSKFMQTLQKWGQDLGKNKFVSSLQSGMMALMGVLMVGAIFQIIQSVLGPSMLKAISATSPWYAYLNIPYQFTMNSIALWVVALMSFQYARKLDLTSPLISMLDALVVFMAVCVPISTDKAGVISLNSTYLSAQGMFIGFLVVFVVIQIEHFCYTKNIRIKMPDVVPQFLQDGFAAIIPLLIELVVFLAVHIIVVSVTAGKYTLASGFMALISTPLNALVSTPGMFVLVFIALLLWTFGIHGSLIVGSILMPITIQAIGVNAALHASGKALQFNAVFLMNAMAVVGGTGNTFPLVLMGLKAKSKQIKAVSKASLIPGWFNINEPVTFGMPIMYNPILAIPYILNVMVVMILTLIGYKIGLLVPAWIPVIANLPIGFMDFLQTLSWKNIVWDYLMIIPSALIWFPFFKVYDKQLYAQEQQKAKEEQEESDEETADSSTTMA